MEKIFKHFTIDYTEPCLRDAVMALLCISVKDMQNRLLHTAVLGDAMLDWSLFELDYPNALVVQNKLGDTGRWVEFMDLVELTEIDAMQELLSGNQPSILRSIRDTLVTEQCYDPSPTVSSTKLGVADICKLFLLTNLAGVTSRVAIQLYTVKRLGCNTDHLTDSLISMFAFHRFNELAYLSTLTSILKLATINVPALQQHINVYKNEKDTERTMVEAHQRAACTWKRPSLREIIRLNLHTQNQDSECSVEKSYQQFVSAVRFPASLNTRLKLQCYLLASMSHVFDYSGYIERVVQKDIAARVKGVTVIVVDPESVTNAILTLGLTPFPSLNEFKRNLACTLSTKQLQQVNLLQYMQLYIAAYQHPTVWRQVWYAIFPVMSTPIAVQIEQFVGTHLFDHNALVEAMAGK